ncbi:proton-conducting transporter membrane subunit [Actinotalea sp. M2MS4P-6]|uniref:proton-conducting transporter transmembrane domain-containing protein n=1 Tax=Actinotalea sp. M2MS4P-6 TaxID=2983762 RepID=UPI0021E40E87|nr:proton-conducting transporter membrane subunit [Actinotalea sp. M2MS4P-6]MCV2395701.1 proton-conducting transporter membrane subunit [Actinotalea sp. M2MS4P-6]
MTPLWVQAAAALLAVLLAVVAPARLRGRLAGAACAVTAGAGVWGGAQAMAGGAGVLVVGTALPGVSMTFAPDRLGGLFIILAGGVGVVASVYGIGYAAWAARTTWAGFAVLLLGMQLVPAAGDVLGFLLPWELMAGGSAVLVLAEHRTRPSARPAGVWYTVMTHLSLVTILGGFALLVVATGGQDFATLATADPAASGAAFVLLTLGFAAKAGLVPLHVWLPRAHPEAPSHASAAMSAAMVKMGLYGLLLVTVRLLPGGPAWWAWTLIGLGAVSAVYGILQAGVASDLKRLLAYSTTENLGLMVLALGVALLLRPAAPVASATALLACLLLAVSHAAFKTTLFLGAGSVLHATGERDLDRLGGLVHTMPWTATTFAIGALGAAALPLTGGFVAEWVLLQALVRGGETVDRTVTVATPLAIGVVALTAGLALLTFVKAFGIGFLARPRTPGTQRAHRAPVSMRAGMVAAAAAVVALGVAPGPVAVALARAVDVPVTSTGVAGIALPGAGPVLDPALVAALGLGLTVPVVAAVLVAARRAPRVVEVPAWGCGAVRDDPRVQYTATSYAEPLLRVFDDALQPERDVEVTHIAESRYLAARVAYRQELSDVVETRLYRPVLRAVDVVADRVRRVHNGSVSRYLTFAFGALVAVLVVVAR